MNQEKMKNLQKALEAFGLKIGFLPSERVQIIQFQTPTQHLVQITHTDGNLDISFTNPDTRMTGVGYHLYSPTVPRPVPPITTNAWRAIDGEAEHSFPDESLLESQDADASKPLGVHEPSQCLYNQNSSDSQSPSEPPLGSEKD